MEQDLLQDFLKSSQMNLDPLFHSQITPEERLYEHVPERSGCDCVLAIISFRLGFFGCSVQDHDDGYASAV